MPEKLNHEIVSNYELYTFVREGRKSLKSKQIILHDDPNHNTGKERIEQLEHPAVSHLELTVNAHKIEKRRYAFKIISRDVCQKPFFRFDAAGATHRNRSPDTPLALQRVTTPHFQFYNNMGYSVAYKTEELKSDEKLKEIDGNINEGIKIFCDESNTFVGDNSYPEIIADFGEIIPFERKDPLADIDFA